MENRITKLRKERDWKQQQLADLMHVTQKTISKWEHGLSEPSQKDWMQLAGIFDVSIDYLLCNTEVRETAAYNNAAAEAKAFSLQSDTLTFIRLFENLKPELRECILRIMMNLK